MIHDSVFSSHIQLTKHKRLHSCCKYSRSFVKSHAQTALVLHVLVLPAFSSNVTCKDQTVWFVSRPGILEKTLQHCGIMFSVPVEGISKGSFQDNFDMLQ